MSASTVKQFKSDQVELILLRLKLSDINAEFWLDPDGFFNYILPVKTNGELPEKSAQINWTRIDEVISQLAYDASILYPESAFSSWYHQHEEYDQVSVKHSRQPVS